MAALSGATLNICPTTSKAEAGRALNTAWCNNILPELLCLLVAISGNWDNICLPIRE
eukprot:CAMPEP_0173185444 /NCGR_PEP_ID=MMETSP1141-20130122/9559_1 /TAXON_ID=483371 /ORGANISM="non described non described, Strain CCMP2298" /LENGTH=56 /DNA_ID=CAMNT_0014108975 /DNA_START=837 /DNA_END=1007 /DNA_ORIENTATION=-